MAVGEGPQESVEGRPRLSPYRVHVPLRFIVQTIVASSLCAFAVARTARYFLLDMQSDYETGGKGLYSLLPIPVLPEGKELPATSYTSKNYNTASRVNSRWVLAERSTRQSQNNSQTDLQGEEEIEKKKVEHAPAGQHLLLDFQFVDGEFLNSETRLAQAMIELVQGCGLTLLSYHCHKLDPAGVSCAGVLLESHVSFHTWPIAGVISLDLYTCGPNSILPVLPLAKRLFGIPGRKNEEGRYQPPRLRWAHKLRGFEDDEVDLVDLLALTDLFLFPIGTMLDYKEEIASLETEFQTIHIYDIFTPAIGTLESYEKSLLINGSYESTNPDLFLPDRIVFMGGMLQSRRSGDAAYHEALVHPGLFVHPNPKRVAIIGGGEGATLREVLKHKTVEKVTMIEIDEMMVEASRKYLPEWSDCSNMLGRSADSCFDDDRVDLYFEDAFKWFKDRFLSAGDDSDEDRPHEDPFDVIIMDALDPQAMVDIVAAIYTDRSFYESLFNGLTPDGILISQIGEAESLTDPADTLSTDRSRVEFVDGLIDIGFEGIRRYTEGACGFFAEWAFLTAFKDRGVETVAWFENEALVNLKISQRMMPTVNNENPLHYFDGAMMQRYRYPSKASEVVYCRRTPTPESCKDGHGFDPEQKNIPINALDFDRGSSDDESVVGEARLYNSKGSYVGLERAVYAARIEPWTQRVIRSTEGNWGNRRWQNGVLESFSHYYGLPVVPDTIYNPVARRQV